MILLYRSCRSRAWNVQQRLQASIRSLTTTNSNNSSIQSKPDTSLVDARNAPSDFTPDCAVVYRDFLTSEEGDLLVEDILSRMKRYVQTVRETAIIRSYPFLIFFMLLFTLLIN
jgi:hypothetical protein